MRPEALPRFLRHNESMKSRLALLALGLSIALFAQQKFTIDQLSAFIQSSIQLKHDDRQVAAYLRKVTITQKLTDSTLEDLQGMGAGPKTVEALRALRVIDAPALRHLTLSRRPLEAADLRALARLPLAGRLTALGLNGLELDDGALQTIAAERASFASLSTLDLSDNELTREGLEVARGVAAEVVSQRQERRGTAAQARLRHFAGSRLAAAEEIADPKAWRDAGREGELLWAHYRGNADYELYVTRGLDAYGCSCPSSIRPCKHVVALALVARSVELPERPAGGIQDRVARYEWEP